MNYFDLIILVPLVWGAIMGFRKGLILELASIAGLILGIWGSIRFSNKMAALLSNYLEASESLISLLSFILTFILIVVAVHLLAKLLDKSLKMAAMGLMVRISGAIFGLLKYALVISVLLYVFEALNNRWGFADEKQYESSISYQSFHKVTGPLYGWLDQLDLDPNLEKLKELDPSDQD